MKNKEIAILLFCLFMVMIGYGLTLPILPFLVKNVADSSDLFGFTFGAYWFSFSEHFTCLKLKPASRIELRTEFKIFS